MSVNSNSVYKGKGPANTPNPSYNPSSLISATHFITLLHATLLNYTWSYLFKLSAIFVTYNNTYKKDKFVPEAHF